RSAAEPAADLHVAVVGADDDGGRERRLIAELVNEGAVAQRLFREIGGAVHVPGRRACVAVDGLPDADRADDQPVTAGGRRLAVVGRRVRVALEKLIGQDERLGIAGPAARAIAPARAGGGTVAGAAVEVTAVVALPEPA